MWTRPNNARLWQLLICTNTCLVDISHLWLTRRLSNSYTTSQFASKKSAVRVRRSDITLSVYSCDIKHWKAASILQAIYLSCYSPSEENLGDCSVMQLLHMNQFYGCIKANHYSSQPTWIGSNVNKIWSYMTRCSATQHIAFPACHRHTNAVIWSISFQVSIFMVFWGMNLSFTHQGFHHHSNWHRHNTGADIEVFLYLQGRQGTRLRIASTNLTKKITFLYIYIFIIKYFYKTDDAHVKTCKCDFT